MSRDAPSVTKPKPFTMLGEPHLSISPPSLRHFPSNRSVWTSSRVYPPFEAMMPYLPSSTMGALGAPYSYHAPPLSPEWESPSYILTMCTDGSGSPQNLSQTETLTSRPTLGKN